MEARMLRGETTRSRSKREVDLPPKRPSKGDEAGTSAGAASSSSSSKRLIFPSKHSKTHTAAPSVDSLLAHADRAQASKGKDGSAASSTPQDPFASTTRRHAPDSIFSASQDSNGSKFTSDGSSLTPPSPKKRKATTLILPSKDPSNLVFAAAGDKEVSSRAESSSGAATVPRAKLMLKLPEKGSVTANEKAAAITPPKRVQDLKTCPFCSRPMPSTPSPLLVKLLQPWLDRLHKSEQINVTDTATSCARHEEEVDVIPRGISRGWPQTLDWSGDITRRVHAHKETLFNKYILLPEESYYMRRATERKLYRKKSIMQTPEALAQTRAGYYGEVGWDLFRSILLRWLTWGEGDAGVQTMRRVPIEQSTWGEGDAGAQTVHTGPGPTDQSTWSEGDVGVQTVHTVPIDQSTWSEGDVGVQTVHTVPIDQSTFLDTVHPLSTWDFVDLVLIPELTCLLIQEDYEVKGQVLTDEETRKVKEESAEYGVAMFPVVDDASMGMSGSKDVEDKDDDDRVPSDEPVLPVKSHIKANRHDSTSTTRTTSSQPIIRASSPLRSTGRILPYSQPAPSKSTGHHVASRQSASTSSQPTRRHLASSQSATPSSLPSGRHIASSQSASTSSQPSGRHLASSQSATTSSQPTPSIRPRPQACAAHTRFPDMDDRDDDDDDFFNASVSRKPATRRVAAFDDLLSGAGGAATRPRPATTATPSVVRPRPTPMPRGKR